MILFYDTETTGLPMKGKQPLDHPLQPRIVQLGALMDFDDGREAQRLDVVIRLPDLPPEVDAGWDKAATFHGITKEMSDQFGVNEHTALNMFLDMVEAADLVVGQNIKRFDNNIVTGCVRRAFNDPSMDPFKDKPQFDTMLAGLPLCRLPSRQGGFKNPTLTELHKHLFGEGFEGAHTAITDVLATRRCFYRLQEIANEGRAAAATAAAEAAFA